MGFNKYLGWTFGIITLLAVIYLIFLIVGSLPETGISSQINSGIVSSGGGFTG